MSFPVFIKLSFDTEKIVAIRHEKDLGVYLHKDGRVEFSRNLTPFLKEVVNNKDDFELFKDRNEAETFLGRPIKNLAIEDLRMEICFLHTIGFCKKCHRPFNCAGHMTMDHVKKCKDDDWRIVFEELCPFCSDK